MKLQLKNSSGLSGSTSVEPSPTQMLDGELAINYNSTDPRLYIKESDGTIGQVPVARRKSHLTINSDGFIGLGTTSPQTMVDLRAGDPKIRMTDLSTSAVHILDANSSSGDFAIKVDEFSDSNDSDFKIETRGSEKLRIKGVTGRLGLGEIAPETFVHIKDGQPYVRIENTFNSVPSNERIWDFKAQPDGNLELANVSDSESTIYKWMLVERNGTETASIRFYTGTAAERLRISPSGVSFNGDTNAVNCLDDYEEGTFTPGYAIGSGGGGATITPVYDQQDGNYTKIGNVVHFRLRLRTDSLNLSGMSTGSIDITGLPFTTGSTYTAVAIYGTGFKNTFNPYQGLVFSNTTTAGIYHLNPTLGNNPSRIQYSDLNTGANDNNLYMAGSYIIA